VINSGHLESQGVHLEKHLKGEENNKKQVRDFLKEKICTLFILEVVQPLIILEVNP
jgi:hypothetical protein